MAEQSDLKTETLAKSVEKISDSKGLVAIGNGIGQGLVALALAFALAMAALFFGVMWGSKWNGNFYPQTKCFELQKIGEKVYKVNTCTGETSEFKSENSSAK